MESSLEGETEAGSPGGGRERTRVGRLGRAEGGETLRGPSGQAMGWAGGGREVTLLRPREGWGDSVDKPEKGVQEKG